MSDAIEKCECGFRWVPESSYHLWLCEEPFCAACELMNVGDSLRQSQSKVRFLERKLKEFEDSQS